MRTTEIFNIDRIIELKTGILCKLHMDLYLISESPIEIKGLVDFKNLRLSWIFFEVENPMNRVLMDNHKPIGLHIHYNDGEQVPVQATNILEAQDIFFAAIKLHFGAEIEV